MVPSTFWQHFAVIALGIVTLVIGVLVDNVALQGIGTYLAGLGTPMPLMKPIAKAGLLLLCVASCTAGSTVWPNVKECVAPLARDVLDATGAVLLEDHGDQKLSDVGKDKLKELAGQHGASTVICAVRSLVEAWKPPATYGVSDADKEAFRRAQASARGQAFLDGR